MTIQIQNKLASSFFVTALGLIAACSGDVTGGNRSPVKFSFTTHALAPATANLRASDQAVDAAGTLVLQDVQVVLGKLELDRSGTADCVGEVEASDDDQGHHGEECEDVSRDPVFVDVPVDGTLHPDLDVPLAAGTYSQLEAKLEPARDRFTDFNAAHPDLVGNSVRVQGTFNGTPFVFLAPVRSKLEMDFDPPLVIDETTKNATIALDVSKWFLDSSGNVIDPSTATPGSDNLQVIENNIRRSFHAFEDDNESGEDHHEGHNNGNDDGHD
ncbi:MAG TPA: hypothetical protein VE110_06780 [Gemmatimonadaceae bacterium]|nr:hypothetical protein [Gemmatimonadaceae bacterium]